MTTPSTNDDQLRAALEQYAANMTPEDFRAFAIRVRPAGEAIQTSHDPAVRQKDVLQSIAGKVQQKQQLRTDPNYINRLKGMK